LEEVTAIPTQHEAVNRLYAAKISEERPQFQPYGSYLNSGLEAQLRADYAHAEKATLAEAKQHINRAKAFIDLAKHYLSAELATVSRAEMSAASRV
ncbi:MAG: hypothetical protein AAGA83_25960, partial [Cyanobacteria bacterium P01_F01_bin.116]